MNTRTARLIRFSGPACATMIAAVSAWAFVNSTACGERDPFRFAATMAADAKGRVAQTAASQSAPPAAEVRVYTPADLLAVPPACLGHCA